MSRRLEVGGRQGRGNPPLRSHRLKGFLSFVAYVRKYVMKWLPA